MRDWGGPSDNKVGTLVETPPAFSFSLSFSPQQSYGSREFKSSCCGGFALRYSPTAVVIHDVPTLYQVGLYSCTTKSPWYSYTRALVQRDRAWQYHRRITVRTGKDPSGPPLRGCSVPGGPAVQLFESKRNNLLLNGGLSKHLSLLATFTKRAT